MAPALPHVRFIFPHAPAQPVTINNGFRMPAWYDIRSLGQTGNDDEKGAMLSLKSVNELIEQEVSSGIPSDRIIVGGFSQGAAMSLLTLLCSTHRLAGVVALSGYLLLSDKAHNIRHTANQNTPVFMGHGTADDVVRFEWGQRSYALLQSLNYNVMFRAYPNLAHSASPQEVDDLTAFLKERLP
ncbi:hypothetical protein RI367_005936 [Sorochytrium milnesiophthora]